MILSTKQKWNFRKKFDKLGPDDCWEWSASTRNGYGAFQIARKMEQTHRVSFFLEHNYLPEFVLHTCDNRICVNPNHLYDGTESQNRIDRSQRGPLHTKQKLTPDDIREIRYLLALGLTQRSIARRFDVSNVAISHINTGKTWSHII